MVGLDPAIQVKQGMPLDGRLKGGHDNSTDLIRSAEALSGMAFRLWRAECL